MALMSYRISSTTLISSGLINSANCKHFSITNQNNKQMNNQNFTTTILVDQSPAEVFKAINNPRAWWSKDIDGNTERLDDEWNYHFGDNHRSKMKVIQMIPDKKVVWLVE